MMRFFIGEIPITLLYFPGIYCTFWLYRFTKKYRKWAIFVVSILLIMTPVYQYEYYSNKIINRDLNKFEYINMPTDWYIEHQEHNASSDELTSSLLLLRSTEYFEKTPKPNNNSETFFNKIKVLTLNETAFLVQKPNTISDKEYYIANYKLGLMCLDNWIVLNSWKHYKDEIDSNLKINKIYDTSSIAIYY